MPEVKVKAGEELNGLGKMLKETIDTNLQDSKKYKRIEKLKASVVIKESTSGVAVTLHFRQGEIEIQNDAIDKPNAYQEAGFENMAYISSGQISPTMALLTRKVKARGNLLVLMKIAPLMVLKG
jgi:putative sterol carrier protein